MATLTAEPVKTATSSDAVSKDELLIGAFKEALRKAKDSGSSYFLDDDNDETYVLLSKEGYNDVANECILMGVADERLRHFDPSKLIPAEEFYKEFGITQEEIDAMPEVEIE